MEKAFDIIYVHHEDYLSIKTCNLSRFGSHSSQQIAYIAEPLPAACSHQLRSASLVRSAPFPSLPGGNTAAQRLTPSSVKPSLSAARIDGMFLVFVTHPTRLKPRPCGGGSRRC